MAKKQLSKQKKNQKEHSKKTIILQKLQSKQIDNTMPAEKPVTALQKIQSQLETIINKRKKEKNHLKQLKKESRIIKKHLTELENQLLDTVTDNNLNHKLQQQLKQLQKGFDKKFKQLEKNNQRLYREISLFNDLEQRVEKRINTLQLESHPWQQKLDYLGVSNNEIVDKISHFESELVQLDEKLSHSDPSVRSLDDFSSKVEQLQHFVTQIQSDYQDQDTRLKLLQANTGNIRHALQQAQTLQQAENQRIDGQLDTINPRLDTLNTEQQNLIVQTQALQQNIDTLKQTSSDLQTEFNQKENQKLLAEHNEHLNQQSEQKYQQFEQQLSSLKDAQQQLIKPLEEQLKELGSELQLLRQAYTEQEREQGEQKKPDEHRFESLIEQIAQFDSLLKLSRDELQEHIQKLREEDQQTHSEQLKHLGGQLEQLAQQLNNVAEQSSQLQTLFSDMQDQQQIDQQHTKELSAQAQTQQQQINEQGEQLQQINPLLEQNLAQNTAQSEQLNQFTDSIEQLQARQAQLNSSEHNNQQQLNNLSRKLEQNYNDIETQVEQLHNHQLEQKTRLHEYHQFQYQQQNQHKELSGELSHLSTRIKNRSQLFGIGLISVLAISTLLFFNKDLLESQTDNQALVSQIKKAVRNDTFSKINALTRQNSTILNDQLGQLRASIKDIKAKQSQVPVLAVTPAPETTTAIKAQQTQQNILQDKITGLETEHKNIKQSVFTLTERVDKIDIKVTKLENTVQNQTLTAKKNSATANTRKQTIIPATSIQTPFYGIQLSGSVHTESIKDFLLKHQLINKTAVYQTELNNKPWYIIILGRYPSFTQARQDLNKLPAPLQQIHPWIRKLP